MPELMGVTRVVYSNTGGHSHDGLDRRETFNFRNELSELFAPALQPASRVGGSETVKPIPATPGARGMGH